MRAMAQRILDVRAHIGLFWNWIQILPIYFDIVVSATFPQTRKEQSKVKYTGRLQQIARTMSFCETMRMKYALFTNQTYMRRTQIRRSPRLQQHKINNTMIQIYLRMEYCAAKLCECDISFMFCSYAVTAFNENNATIQTQLYSWSKSHGYNNDI